MTDDDQQDDDQQADDQQDDDQQDEDQDPDADGGNADGGGDDDGNGGGDGGDGDGNFDDPDNLIGLDNDTALSAANFPNADASDFQDDDGSWTAADYQQSAENLFGDHEFFGDTMATQRADEGFVPRPSVMSIV